MFSQKGKQLLLEAATETSPLPPPSPLLLQAEQLHKAVHMLLEWLSDAEMKLRFAGPLPEDEATTRQQMEEHQLFMREMEQQETNKVGVQLLVTY